MQSSSGVDRVRDSSLPYLSVQLKLNSQRTNGLYFIMDNGVRL